MTFYEELQLNQAGSKQLIRDAKVFKEKLRHAAIYLFKIFLTLTFCIAFVIGYNITFGDDNSIVGVVIVLCLMVFRNADLGIHTRDAIPTLILIFVILAFGPHFAHHSNIFIGLITNLICIGVLMVLGCHNVIMHNHSTLVLGYLLLYGYNISGPFYHKRLMAVALGGILTGIIYYRNHRHKPYEETFKHLFSKFDLHTSRTRWQICLTLGVSSIVFLGELFQFPRVMWAGIAVMSIIAPSAQNLLPRVKQRILGNIVGGILFFLIYSYCPDFIYNNIGIIGGIGVGFSATYGWQAVFNTFGAISIAATFLGVPGAIFYRIFHNIVGATYGLLFDKLFNRLIDYLTGTKATR